MRETNPHRNIVLGPVFWNSRDDLNHLKLRQDDRPPDRHLSRLRPVSFHHQGTRRAGPEVEKLSGIRWTGSAAEVAQINTDFDKVAAWSRARNRPILLGEYGAYNMHGKLEDRAAWTKAVSKASDDRGFARAYWFWDGGFGVWDEQKRQWVAPIKDALVGQ
ncbi:endoglucanase H [Asticcacaulis biprosthecium C19]|uniref:Endoglucanase H n=1 Tax=Asticcacaulis biprosthecium C19 TaxID=715226 RepID=F4QS69_9CAUL|nr:endoglucanase H [Asticcacaulis biprosthecium C19]